jgi:hypothetical protein
MAVYIGNVFWQNYVYNSVLQWMIINQKQNTRWHHLSWLKASAFLFGIFLLGVKKH